MGKDNVFFQWGFVEWGRVTAVVPFKMAAGRSAPLHEAVVCRPWIYGGDGV